MLQMFYVDPRLAREKDDEGVGWYRFLLPAITKLLQVGTITSASVCG